LILVVDASAAVEYLLQTTVGLRVAGILEGMKIAAPELLDGEAVADLRDWGLERVAHRSLLEEAWSVRGTASDALYVALARLRRAALITADGPLSRLPGIGVTVQNVRLA